MKVVVCLTGASIAPRRKVTLVTAPVSLNNVNDKMIHMSYGCPMHKQDELVHLKSKAY